MSLEVIDWPAFDARLGRWMSREQQRRNRRTVAIGLALALAAMVIGCGGAYVLIRMVGI